MFNKKNKRKSTEQATLELLDLLLYSVPSDTVIGNPSISNTVNKPTNCIGTIDQMITYQSFDHQSKQQNNSRGGKLKITNINDEYDRLVDEISALLSCGNLSINDIDQSLRIKHVVWYSFAFKYFRSMSGFKDFQYCYNFLLALYDDVIYSLEDESPLAMRLIDRYSGYYNFAINNTEFMRYVQKQEKIGDRGLPVLEGSLPKNVRKTKD